MLVKQHAMELARHGITVNGVAPTVVRSAMANHWLDNPDTRAQILDRIPLGRVGEPDDVVGPALLFCAPAGGFVTGTDPLHRRRRHREPVAGAASPRFSMRRTHGNSRYAGAARKNVSRNQLP